MGGNVTALCSMDPISDLLLIPHSEGKREKLEIKGCFSRGYFVIKESGSVGGQEGLHCSV